MKLRLRNNSIRFRLTQSEVARLAEDGTVEEAINFGPLPTEALTYVLSASADSDAIKAEFNGERIEVFIPKTAVDLWSSTDQVGIEAVQNIDNGKLQILIEKDFRCLEPRTGGDDEDTFPNPQQCVAK